MDEDVDQLKEEWITEAVLILRSGRGHMGIINHLRSYGLSPESAKTVSYHVFDKALIRVKRVQLLQHDGELVHRRTFAERGIRHERGKKSGSSAFLLFIPLPAVFFKQE